MFEWVICECRILLMIVIDSCLKFFLCWWMVSMLSIFWVGCVWCLLLLLIIVMLGLMCLVMKCVVFELLWCIMNMLVVIVFRLCRVLVSVLFLLVEEVDMFRLIMLVDSCWVVSLKVVWVCVEFLKNML